MNKESGMTLVELMVGMAITIVLMVAGIPLFQSVQDNSQLTGQTNIMVSALNLARSEAISRNRKVVARANVGTADSCAGTSSDWRNGVTVFVDTDSDGALDSGEEIVRVLAETRGCPAIAFTIHAIQFNPDGIADSYNSSGNKVSPQAPSTFSLSKADATNKRCITVSITGQIRTERAVCP